MSTIGYLALAPWRLGPPYPVLEKAFADGDVMLFWVRSPRTLPNGRLAWSIRWTELQHQVDQQTNAANVPVGTPNTPVEIPGGEFRTFLIALTPNQAFAATDIQFTFDCTNTSPASDTPGVNRLLLTSSAGPTPDIIAIAVAVGGTVSMPVGGTGALAVATANVGAGASIVVTADTGGTVLPLELTLCQTNPQTAQCLPGTSPATSVTTQINAGETPTYTVFGKATGPIASNPGLHRINVRYKTQAGGTVGSTSVAVRTE